MRALARVLELEEGYSPVPFRDSEGYVTIGYGTRLHSIKGLTLSGFTLTLTKEIAYQMLLLDVERFDAALRASQKALGVDSYSRMAREYPNRRLVILAMCYQMGVEGVLSFTDMWKAIDVHDFQTASEAMLDSLWATQQTPERASRMASIMYYDNFLGAYPKGSFNE